MEKRLQQLNKAISDSRGSGLVSGALSKSVSNEKSKFQIEAESARVIIQGSLYDTTKKLEKIVVKPKWLKFLQSNSK